MKMSIARVLFILAPLYLLTGHAIAVNATGTTMEVRYYDRGTQDARHAYKFELIRAILESTRAEFGDYTILPFGEEPSAKRQSLLISEGKILNLLWASPGTAIAKGDVITIPVDILRGLAGFRVCLINPVNFPSGTIESLQQLQLGQGLNWADMEVYKYNGILPKQGPTFESLFEMLAAQRYHCLPLGADEVMFTWREKKVLYPFLTLEPNLLIYYDYPVYLHVSKRIPALAERVALGLKKLQENGEFLRLFNKHHATDVAQLRLDQRKVFCLRSPYLPQKGQCEKTLNYPQLPAKR